MYNTIIMYLSHCFFEHDHRIDEVRLKFMIKKFIQKNSKEFYQP